MAAERNEIVPRPRKSLRSIRRSQLARMSGYLDPDSNIYSDEDEHPLWWKEIENNTVNFRRSHQTVYDSPVLNPNSDVEGTPLQKSWYKHLDETMYLNRRSSVPKRQPSNAADDKSLRSSESSLTDDIIHKKRSKFHVKKGSTRQPEFETILNRMSESTRLNTRDNMPKDAANKTGDGSDSSVDNRSIKKKRRFLFKKPSKTITPLGSPGAQSSGTVFEDALDGTIEEETGTKSKEVSNTISAKSSDIPIQPDVSALARRMSTLPTADRSTDTSAETARLNLSKRRRMFTKKRKRISVNYENLWTSKEDNEDVTASPKSGHTSRLQQKVEQIMPEKASKTADDPEMQNLSPMVRRSYKRQKLSTPHMVESAAVEESLNTQIMEASDIDSITPSPPSPTINKSNIEIAGRNRSKTNKPQIRSIETVHNELIKLQQLYPDDVDSEEFDEKISLVWRTSEKSSETTGPSKSTKSLQRDNREARNSSPILPRNNHDKRLSTLRMMKSAESQKQLHTQSQEESDIEPITPATPSLILHEEHIKSPGTNRSKTNKSQVQSVESRRKKIPISPEKSKDDSYTEYDDYADSSLQTKNTPRSVRIRSEEGKLLSALHSRNMANFEESVSAANMEESDIDPITSSASSSTINEKDGQVTARGSSRSYTHEDKVPEPQDNSGVQDSHGRSKSSKKPDSKSKLDPANFSSSHSPVKRWELRSLSRQSNISEVVNDPIREKAVDKRSRSVRDSLKMDTIYEKTTSIDQPSRKLNSMDSSKKTVKIKKPTKIVRTAQTPEADKISEIIESDKEIENSEAIEMDQLSKVVGDNEAVEIEESVEPEGVTGTAKTPQSTAKNTTSGILRSIKYNPMNSSKKTRKTKKPAKIVRTSKTPEDNKISEIIESGKEIENSEAIEMDQTSRVVGDNEAVEFEESVEPDGVSGTAKAAQSTARNTSTGVLRSMKSNSMNDSKKIMKTKKPTKIVRTAQTPEANKISEIIESDKEIANSEPIEIDQPSRVVGDNEAVEFEESVKPEGVTGTAKTPQSTAKNTTSGILRSIKYNPMNSSKKTRKTKKPAKIVRTSKTPEDNKISEIIESGKEIENSEAIEMDQPSRVVGDNEAVEFEESVEPDGVSGTAKTAQSTARNTSTGVLRSMKSNSMNDSKKIMKTKKPAKIVRTAKTPKANKISEIIASGKEIANSEPIEMDQPSRVVGDNEAVEFEESVKPEGVSGTAKTAQSTAKNTSTGILRSMDKEKSIAKPNPPTNDNLLSQLQSLSEHENDDKWEKAKRALEDVKKKQMASMKMAPIDSYFKVISKDKSVLTGYSQKSGKKPAQKTRNVAQGDNSIPRNVNKAYIVNGQVYKRPKLPRPKSWVTDRLYKFFFKQLEPNFRLNTRVRAEKFVKTLSEAVSVITRRKKYTNYESELNSLIEKMARLNLIQTLHDFHVFCQEFMPYDFRIKVVPMLLPGNVRNIPFHPEKLHEPIHLEE